MKRIIPILIIVLLLSSCTVVKNEIENKIKKEVGNYIPIEKMGLLNEVKNNLKNLTEEKNIKLNDVKADYTFKILEKKIEVKKPYIVIDGKVYSGEGAIKIYDLLKKEVNSSKFIVFPKDINSAKIVLISGKDKIILKKSKKLFLNSFINNKIIKEPTILKKDTATYFEITLKNNEKINMIINPKGSTYTLINKEGIYTNYKSDKTNIISLVNKIIKAGN